MEEKTQNTELNLSEADEDQISGDEAAEPGSKNAVMYILPLLLCVLLFAGFTQEPVNKKSVKKNVSQEQTVDEDDDSPKINLSALLAAEEFSKNLRDTVYTSDDVWLEFRIDQQMLYVHYRDGRIIKYPVSSGIAGAHKSVSSRPGLFAIFHMN
ncbi:MAG TPA: hypothetical protein PLN22_08520, partial [Ignavibacteria bacterium]|nr:hypothetical protein [Ignavibacteria bacterium]